MGTVALPGSELVHNMVEPVVLVAPNKELNIQMPADEVRMTDDKNYPTLLGSNLIRPQILRGYRLGETFSRATAALGRGTGKRIKSAPHGLLIRNPPPPLCPRHMFV